MPCSSNELPISPICSRCVIVLCANNAPSSSGFVARKASTIPFNVANLEFILETSELRWLKCAPWLCCSIMLFSVTSTNLSWVFFSQYPVPPPAPMTAIPNKAVSGSIVHEFSLPLYAHRLNWVQTTLFHDLLF